MHLHPSRLRQHPPHRPLHRGSRALHQKAACTAQHGRRVQAAGISTQHPHGWSTTLQGVGPRTDGVHAVDREGWRRGRRERGNPANMRRQPSTTNGHRQWQALISDPRIPYVLFSTKECAMHMQPPHLRMQQRRTNGTDAPLPAYPGLAGVRIQGGPRTECPAVPQR